MERVRKKNLLHHKSEAESFNIYSFKWIPAESLLSQIYIWFCIELCRYVGLKNSYKIRRNAKTCWKDSSAEMRNTLCSEILERRICKKRTITMDIFLLMILIHFFGRKVCWCLVIDKGKLRKHWYSPQYGQKPASEQRKEGEPLKTCRVSFTANASNVYPPDPGPAGWSLAWHN